MTLRPEGALIDSPQGTFTHSSSFPFNFYGIRGSSELGVGGGVEASCDEEYSEFVVGGVAVASGGASASFDNVR